MQVLESHYGSLDARHLGCLRAIQWEGEWDVGVINGMSGSYICSDSGVKVSLRRWAGARDFDRLTTWAINAVAVAIPIRIGTGGDPKLWN